MAAESGPRQYVPLTCHGHSRPVPHLSFSPLEKEEVYYMISACKDNNPMLRDGQTGDWIGTFLGHKGAVWQARLSPDSSTAATASADFTAKVWDTHTGELLYVLQHNHIVRAIAYPFDNSGMLATGGFEKKLRIFDLLGHKPPSPSPSNPGPVAPVIIEASRAFEIGEGTHKDPIKFVIWAMDPNVLVTASSDTLRWFDLPSRRCIRETRLEAEIRSCELVSLAAPHSSPTDIGGGLPVLAVAAGSTAYFWGGPRAEDNIKQITVPHKIASVGLDLKGRKFVVGEENGTWARVYDWETGNEIDVHKGHHGPIWSIAFSPDGNLYATGSEDGTVKMWKNCDGFYGLWRGGIRSPNDMRPEMLTASLYDIVPTMAAPQATSINAIAITPDLRYWMTGGSDGYVRKYDGLGTINGRQQLTVAQRHPFVDSVTKAGILMSYWGNEEPAPPSARAEERVQSPVYSLAVHSGALWLLSGLESGGINLQSVRHDEGKRIHCLQGGHTNAVSMLQLAPDERSVLSGSWDKTILDWDLDNGHIIRRFEGSGGQISAIELRPANGAPIPAEASEAEAKSETLNGWFANGVGAADHAGGGTERVGIGVGVGVGVGADVGVGAGIGNGNGIGNGIGIGIGIGARAGAGVGGNDIARGAPADGASPEHESLFGSPAGSLFGDNETIGGGGGGGGGGGAFGNDDDDEFSRAMDMGSLHDEPGHQGMDHPGDFAMGDADAANALPPSSAGQEPGGSDATADHHEGLLGSRHLNGHLSTSDTTMANGDATSQDASVDFSQAPTEPQHSVPPPSSGLDQQEQYFQHLSPADAFSQPAPLASMVYSSSAPPPHHDATQTSASTFLSAAIDGTIRIWDRRVPDPVARIGNRRGVPPWCMGACWSPDGNWIYAGRRNGTVEEFSIHKARGGWQPERTLKFPAGSGAVSCVRSMVNGRHLVCASHDILRLYDLRETAAFKHSKVPFVIIPGPPRAGVISSLYIDPTSRIMISAAGTRGWDGSSTEVLIGYEINVMSS
ncbi:WD40-repeat-containing domain protein [Diplogelasinospora grovesii]|uniref:Serine-threonine kinase receptor-associated protein n=1 Tax=Diplogelasinospora grovesii TaxID=303347 RepID=A0AAN6S6T6_9PEZI|nr:WD40-repeat-containing domain protein [Diplogelasinospora grovesii]